ncbi:hypothetical protein B4U80_03261 [Leptotrombidium deliense]|uniref:Uncharacterized protein n=1 Tax=Leptotrombidium deliense TaxID=299467 RepID=A0A443S0J6_9ACAR|nr:hypothetical protein B4U80_03261 [Leptotrombidium deliense]
MHLLMHLFEKRFRMVALFALCWAPLQIYNITQYFVPNINS